GRLVGRGAGAAGERRVARGLGAGGGVAAAWPVRGYRDDADGDHAVDLRAADGRRGHVRSRGGGLQPAVTAVLERFLQVGHVRQGYCGLAVRAPAPGHGLAVRAPAPGHVRGRQGGVRQLLEGAQLRQPLKARHVAVGS
ncbi:hypothetical protein T484DRAFT_1899380, partial [Baffinella frigidus]